VYVSSSSMKASAWDGSGATQIPRHGAPRLE
jgi:hypothetical protein